MTRPIAQPHSKRPCNRGASKVRRRLRAWPGSGWVVLATVMVGIAQGAAAQELDKVNELARSAQASTARHELKVISATRLTMRKMLRERAEEEASTDRRPLLGRKLAVDSALAPLLLLLELCLDRQHEPLALLRFDYQDRELRLLTPTDGAGAAIDALGASWKEAAASGTGFSYRSQRVGAVGDDFPALIHWHGWLQGDSISARAHWFEPFLAQRRLDFPLNPENLKIEFTPRSATITSMLPSEMTRSEQFSSSSPRLVNPADVYDLFDGLRIGASVLTRSPERTSSPTGDSLLVGDDAPAQQESHHRIRSAAWERSAAQITRCTIWQPVVLLHYETAHRLVGQARMGASVVGGAEVIPSTELEWFVRGLEADLYFRPPDSARDTAQDTARDIARDSARDRLEVPLDSGATLALPAAISLLSDGALLSQAAFGPFLIGPSAARVFERIDAAWPMVIDAVARRDAILATAPERLAAGEAPAFTDQEVLGEIDPLVARWRLRANLLRAVRTNDAPAHDLAMSTMARRLSQDGVEPRWAVMNAQAWIEELAGPLDRPEAAIQLAIPAWIALVVQLPPEEAISEMARLIVSGRWGLALLLARSLDGERLPPGGIEWIARVSPRLEGWARGDDTAPIRDGPHPDWDARVDQAVLEVLNTGVAP